MPSYAGEIWTAFATLNSEGKAQALSEALERMEEAPTGVGCFEVDEDEGLWEVAGYFGDKPDSLSLTLLEAGFGTRFVVSKVPPQDWVSKVRRELTPVRAGRFTLHGGHDEGDAPPATIRLLIEAAMAFGTGHHGTTRGCLLAMDGLARRGFNARSVLDLGTGTGALAMGAAKLWKADCVAVDIDPVAVWTARDNARANGVSSLMRCGRANGARSDLARSLAPYDLVFANILAGPLKRLAPQIASVTGAGSAVVLSGILNRQARGVEAVYAGWGMPTQERIVLGEWTTLRLERG